MVFTHFDFSDPDCNHSFCLVFPDSFRLNNADLSYSTCHIVYHMHHLCLSTARLELLKNRDRTSFIPRAQHCLVHSMEWINHRQMDKWTNSLFPVIQVDYLKVRDGTSMKFLVTLYVKLPDTKQGCDYRQSPSFNLPQGTSGVYFVPQSFLWTTVKTPRVSYSYVNQSLANVVHGCQLQVFLTLTTGMSNSTSSPRAVIKEGPGAGLWMQSTEKGGMAVSTEN